MKIQLNKNLTISICTLAYVILCQRNLHRTYFKLGPVLAIVLSRLYHHCIANSFMFYVTWLLSAQKRYVVTCHYTIEKKFNCTQLFVLSLQIHQHNKSTLDKEVNVNNGNFPFYKTFYAPIMGVKESKINIIGTKEIRQ